MSDGDDQDFNPMAYFVQDDNQTDDPITEAQFLTTLIDPTGQISPQSAEDLRMRQNIYSMPITTEMRMVNYIDSMTTAEVQYLELEQQDNVLAFPQKGE